MAKKESQLDEGIIDLTELIEPGNAAGKAGAAAAEEDDFGAILAKTQEAPKSSAGPVDPHESLDMSGMGGIDNLLESLDIPAQPREGKAAAQPAPDDLDNALEDLLDSPPKQAQTEPAPAPEPDAKGALDADLDDILASFDEPAPRKSQPAPQPAPEPENLSADIDDILGDLEPPAPAPEPPKKTPPRPAPAPETPAAGDLDDLLGDLDLEPAPPRAAPKAAPKPAPEPPRKTPPAETVAQPPLEDIDDFLGGLDAPEPPAPSAAPRGGSGADMSAPPRPARTERVPAEPAREAPGIPAHVMTPVPAEVSGKDSPHQAIAVQTWPSDMIAGICQGIASAQGGDREAMQEFSRELGAQSAHVQDMGGQLTQLGKRLLACESKLSAARARIAGLEKGLEAAAALEDLLKDGTPLHAGFMALIASAVGNALKSFTPQTQDRGEMRELAARLEERLRLVDEKMAVLEKKLAESQSQGSADGYGEVGKLDARIWSADVRIEALEKRVDELARTFGSDLERVASASVAKVLQEEISKLAQS